MGFLDKFIDKDKLAEQKGIDIVKAFNDILRKTSGAGYTRDIGLNLFYQIIAFKGISDGVGTSTLVANTALAIADLGLTVCVVDTSILHPMQDTLLKTNMVNSTTPKEKRLDWFDLPYTDKSVLHPSSRNKAIDVLSFYGKDRTVVDALSINDSASLVEMAFTEIHNKYDIILVDCCDELTSINTTALQMSQTVIQVWNDSPAIISNLDNFITNCVTMSCPLDKMRFVVLSKICKNTMGGIDSLLKQYRCNLLTQTYNDEEIYTLLNRNKPVYNNPSNDPEIIAYTESIIRITCHICNIDIEEKNKEINAPTSNDIVEGKVDGTLHKKYRELEEVYEELDVATTLEECDSQLTGGEDLNA